MTVIVYSLPVCPNCLLAKIFLEQHGIEFDEVNLANNRQKADELIQKTNHRSAPIIEIDGEYLCGFDKEILAKKLGL